MFKYLPDTPVAWRDVWIGSVVTALLFTLGKTGLEIYISKAAPESGYGAAGALALVLVWVYYSAQIFLMGAEFTNVYATEEGSRTQEKQEVHAPDIAAAPSPIASLPRPAKTRGASGAHGDLPDAVLGATMEKLPALLGLGKGHKIRPLRFLGRLTGAALTLAAAGLAGRKSKKAGRT
jgi:membrane protein